MKVAENINFLYNYLVPEASLSGPFLFEMKVIQSIERKFDSIMRKSVIVKRGAPISVEHYRKLVAMLAWKAWRKLPMQTRMWIGPDDMIEDGMYQVVRLTYSYNPNWAGFSTAVYHRLHKYYINEYLEFHSALKRGWETVQGANKGKRWENKMSIAHQSLEALTTRMQDKLAQDESYLMPQSLVVHERSIVDNAITECFVVPALEKVYQEASPKLQAAMTEWFLTEDKSRVHKNGKKFNRRASEFRCLCKTHDITCTDCLHLIRSVSCLDTLSRKIVGIPFYMDFPTPIVDRII